MNLDSQTKPPTRGGILNARDSSQYQFSTVVDAARFGKTLRRLAHEINEHQTNLEDVVFVAVMNGGEPIAKRLQELMLEMFDVSVPQINIDTTMSRDDIELRPVRAFVSIEESVSVQDKRVILIDDVICSGRTVRAAISSVFELGRPASIELAVAVSRSQRELPIDPTYVGKHVPTNALEYVLVTMERGIEIGRPMDLDI